MSTVIHLSKLRGGQSDRRDAATVVNIAPSRNVHVRLDLSLDLLLTRGLRVQQTI